MGSYKAKHVSQKQVKHTRNRIFVRALKFTETVIFWVTLLFIINWFVSVALIIIAILTTSNFSYLDTLIIETNQTFREIVGVAIIKFGIENIFKYNDFGGKIPSKSIETSETNKYAETQEEENL